MGFSALCVVLLQTVLLVVSTGWLGVDHQRGVLTGHMSLSGSPDSQGSVPVRPAPLVMHSEAWGGQYSSQLAPLGVIYGASLWELTVVLQRRRIHTDLITSVSQVKMCWVLDAVFLAKKNINVLVSYWWSDAEWSVYMCQMMLLWFQDNKLSNKSPQPGCCVPTPAVITPHAGKKHDSPFSLWFIICHIPSMNVSVFIHVYAAIHTPHCQINTSHKLWMLYHLHTYSVSHSDPLARSGPFVVVFAWCSSRSGWHCDHGCHTTQAVFSKTAEDLLAHVTTASRLTCYHGDKPANENSADGCDVDCKLFVLRGDLFFFYYSPLCSYSDTDPVTLCTCTQTFNQIKKTWEGYSHTNGHVKLGCKVDTKEASIKKNGLYNSLKLTLI